MATWSPVFMETMLRPKVTLLVSNSILERQIVTENIGGLDRRRRQIKISFLPPESLNKHLLRGTAIGRQHL